MWEHALHQVAKFFFQWYNLLDMTPENVGERNDIEVCYDPKDIIAFFEEHGPFTSKEVRSKFSYSEEVVSSIIMDLHSLSIVDSSDEDWRYDKEDQALYKTYRLNDEGKMRKDTFKPRRFTLTPMPSLAKLSTGLANDLLRAANSFGLSLEELADRVRSGELNESIQRTALEVLREFSADELRDLAREKRFFGKGSKPTDQT